MAKIPASLIRAAQRQPIPVGRSARGSGEVLKPGKSTYESCNVPGAQASEKKMDLSVGDDASRPKPPGSPIAPLIKPEARGKVVPTPGEFAQPNTTLPTVSQTDD
jgi:hypothetical protein